ncbi:SDR family oxidoreductase [Methylophilaceae bacterium]|jgi:NAD(P)-dependent dehydrogenase (short-subunit alcohol dehydrogenase family)|nr:SDR family oxidoreductase [Methylophilaceae bacterium]
MFNLKDKVVLVVGGRGYLGREFCRALREQNAHVISADLPFPSKAAKKSSFKSYDDDIEQMDVDVTNKDSIDLLVSKIEKKHSKIDTLIYSVTAKPDDFYLPFTECSLEGWQSVLHAELDGLFLTAQIVGKLMESEKKGSMIFISSIYGVVGNDQRIYEGSNLDNLYTNQSNTSDKKIYSHSVYPVVKGGIISLTRYLAAYWGGSNIRVNAISPGGIYHEGENEVFLKKYSEKVPLGRKANINEISSSVVYLSSDEASYITGQNLIIDGGWTAW